MGARPLSLNHPRVFVLGLLLKYRTWFSNLSTKQYTNRGSKMSPNDFLLPFSRSDVWFSKPLEALYFIILLLF